MRHTPAVLLVVLMTFVLLPPVHAQMPDYQTTLGIHYWGAPLRFGNPAPPSASDSGSGWGFTLRMDHRQSPWSLSGRYDSLSVTPLNWPWNRAALWDAHIHYRFGPSPESYFGVLAGWGGVNVTAIVPAQDGSATGPRIGAEFMQRMPGGLYLTGQVAYGFSWTTSLVGFPGTPNSTVTDWRIAAGYEFAGGWGLEAGWRSLSWRIPTSSGCPGPTGCEMVFSGVTAALTFRR